MSTTDEIRLPGELPLWRVPGWLERYGIDAGITGRATASGEVFDLGLWGSRSTQATMRDWRSFRRAFPWAKGLSFSHQMHGNVVHWHGVQSPGWTIGEDGDGHLTDLPAQLLLVTVADCVPVYLAVPEQGIVGLLHAGWRGTAGAILAQAVGYLRGKNVMSKSIVMHLGVSISWRSYEVGNEVASPLGLDVDNSGKCHADLRAILRRQGEELGIETITVSGHDTATEPGDFYSHRGSGGAEGRMVAWVGRPG